MGMNEWLNGCLTRWLNGWLNGKINRRMNKRMNGRINGWLNGSMNGMQLFPTHFRAGAFTRVHLSTVTLLINQNVCMTGLSSSCYYLSLFTIGCMIKIREVIKIESLETSTSKRFFQALQTKMDGMISQYTAILCLGVQVGNNIGFLMLI